MLPRSRERLCVSHESRPHGDGRGSGQRRNLDAEILDRPVNSVLLLLAFGKYICNGGDPRCLSCPLIDVCSKIGVTKARK